MPEAIIVGLVLSALLAMACWTLGPCRVRLRRREQLIEVCLVLLGLIQDLQLHRVLSGAMLDKRRDFRKDFDANEYKLLRSLDAVSERYARQHMAFGDERWRVVLGRWEALRHNWRELPFETSIFAHSQVITGLIEILTSLAQDNRRLLGERYSRCIAEWPRLIEDLGLLRAMGLHLLGHRTTREGQLQTDTIAAQLNSGRSRLRQLNDEAIDHALVVRTERAFHRVSWLLDRNAEGYHPYTFYEEMTLVIDDWYQLLRGRLQETAPRESITRRLVTILRLNPKASG